MLYSRSPKNPTLQQFQKYFQIGLFGVVEVPFCHNDVNIMITKGGDCEVAVLIDFDSCVQAGQPLGKTTILDPGGRTSHVGIDWRGLQKVETELRRVFPRTGCTSSDEGVQAV